MNRQCLSARVKHAIVVCVIFGTCASAIGAYNLINGRQFNANIPAYVGTLVIAWLIGALWIHHQWRVHQADKRFANGEKMKDPL